MSLNEVITHTMRKCCVQCIVLFFQFLVWKVSTSV